jgi:phenylacetate-CoA ligase
VREGDREQPASPGELGEVVITDLHNFGMPFIRYANGDLAAAGPDEPCACGRGLERIQEIHGRVAESFRKEDGTVVCGLLFSRIFSWSPSLARTVRHWQVIRHADASLTIKVEASRPIDAEAHADLRRSFDQYLPGTRIEVERVDAIPVGDNGKRRLVVVEE